MIDMGQVTFMDSAGLSALVDLRLTSSCTVGGERPSLDG
ncbi:hypothetical protein [Streptomyces sp. enrichment culture]